MTRFDLDLDLDSALLGKESIEREKVGRESMRRESLIIILDKLNEVNK